MKVLVIGGQGFIGSHIVSALSDLGADITVFSRSFVASDLRYKFIQGDFLDLGKLSTALYGVDVVIHALSTTVPSTSSANPVYDVETNLIGTINLLELMSKYGAKRLVYLSSGGTVYGSVKVEEIAESHRLNPISSYGAIKVAIEKMIHVFQAQDKISSAIIRPSNPYGVGQTVNGVQGLISTIMNNHFSGKVTNVYGSGEAIRDYIYVSDVANLVVKAAICTKNGIYNAGSGVGYSVNQIISIISTIIGAEIPFAYVESRGFDVDRIILNTEKAKKDFNWDCTVNIEQGIENQYLWMKSSTKG